MADGAALLKVDVRHQVGRLRMEILFALTQPWTMLFGPSGSGKSTVLRAIAGFVCPLDGQILYGKAETPLVDVQRGVCLPPHRRPVRSAGQTARLFDHMDVQANVGYGLGSGPRGSSLPSSEILTEVLRLFRLTDLGKRRPLELSGGERQRVSVARAVVAAVTFDGPGQALLLLDEPFSGLDSTVRDKVALELRDLLFRWKTPVLSVSHDVGEAFLLAPEMIRMHEGRIVEQGPVTSVLRLERDRLLSHLRD